MNFLVLLALLPLVACQFDAFYRGSSDNSDNYWNELPSGSFFDNSDMNDFSFGDFIDYPIEYPTEYISDFSFGDFIDYPIEYPTEYISDFSFGDFIDYPIEYPTEYISDFSFGDFIDYPIEYPTEYISDFSFGDFIDYPIEYPTEYISDFSFGDFIDYPIEYPTEYISDFSFGDFIDYPIDFPTDFDFSWDLTSDFSWDISDWSGAEDIVCEDLYDRASNFRVKKRDYTNDLARCWTIHSEGELRLKFGKFDVEALSGGCAYDRVRITDNYGFDEEYCGSDVDFGRIDTTGTTTVTFTTDGSVTAGGFFLRWKTRN